MSLKTLVLAGGAVLALAAAPLTANAASTATHDTAANATAAPSSTAKSTNAKTAANEKSTASKSASADTNQTASNTGIPASELKSASKLTTVTNPEQTLADAKVETKDGTDVGSVKKVVLDTKGKAKALEVDVGGFLGIGAKRVSINASRFSYIPDRKLLVANLTKNQAKAMPEVKDSDSSSTSTSKTNAK